MLLSRLNAEEQKALDSLAAEVGASAADLYWLIEFESAWNPQAVHPSGEARGLIQFRDSTARGLGFRDAADLVGRFPTRTEQIAGPVRAYLLQYAPLSTQQSTYLSVFYPAYRYADKDKVFPAAVTAANPGITTVADYIRKVNSKRNRPILIAAAVLVVGLVGTAVMRR